VLGLVLILPVDWFVGIARALTNLIGNCVATVIVAVWENDIDRVRARRVLNQEPDVRFIAGVDEGGAAEGVHGVPTAPAV
jgi:aerobic C4-dicarboxylate transport protein